MTNADDYNETAMIVIKAQALEAAKRSEDLEKQYTKAKRIKEIWDDILTFLTRDWPCHLLHLLNQEKMIIVGNEESSRELTSTIDQIYKKTLLQADILKKRFPAYIEEACRNNNLTIDRGSRHPKYTFSEGFFRLEIDDRKLIARLFDYEGKLAEFPADVEAIVEVIKREHKRVFDRRFDGFGFIRKLLNQYLAIIEKENLPDGTELPIRKITRRLGKNIDGFRTDEFLIDLSRLAEKGPTEIDGRRLYLQHTKDTKQGMLLYGLGSGYVGYVVFKKE